MKIFFKNLFILIIGLLITVTIVYTATVQVLLNKEEIKSVLSKSNIYTQMNDLSKDIAIKTLNEAVKDINEEYEIEIPVKELIDGINISDLYELLTTEIIELAYSEEEPKITINYLTNRYLDKIDSYLEEKHIKLPEDVKKSLHDSLTEDSLDEIVDTNEIEESLKDVQEVHLQVKAAVNTVGLILVILAGVPALLIIIFCKKKVKEIIKLLFIPTALLIGLEYFIRNAKTSVTDDLGELLISLFDSVTTLIFDKIHMFLVVMIAIMVLLIIIKIVFTKTPKEIEEENKEKEEQQAQDETQKPLINKKVDEDGNVISAFDKF